MSSRPHYQAEFQYIESGLLCLYQKIWPSLIFCVKGVRRNIQIDKFDEITNKFVVFDNSPENSLLNQGLGKYPIDLCRGKNFCQVDYSSVKAQSRDSQELIIAIKI